ncbi:hypothetical protein [Micromonospora sp. NPDC049662]|uniref:hypothetical protein n=1 Tax=Micromonospora sp. NPDC049662 TaxID=3155397 RepID=UPI003442D601
MFPLSVIGAIALGIGGVCLVRGSAPRFRTWCFLAVGIALAGWIGKLVGNIVGDATVAANRIGATLIGVSLGAAIAVAALTWLWHDLRKKGGVSKPAWIVALVVPSLVPALYVALMTVPALQGVATEVRSFVVEMRAE